MFILWRNRIIGILLIVGAVLGLFLSLAGIGVTWTVAPQAQAQIDSTLDLFDRSLTTTSQGLVVIQNSLTETQKTISLMEASSNDIASSIDQTIPMVDATGTLIGDQMAQVIKTTQASLNAAQSSAKLVDDTLGLITAIPFIGGRYAPSLSLSQSISGVSNSLQGLPDSFTALKSNLTTSSNNLKEMKAKVEALSQDIHQVGVRVDEARGVITTYQTQVAEMQAQVETVRQRLPLWMGIIKWGVTLFLVWLALAQISLAGQGLALLQEPKKVVIQRDLTV